MKTFDFPYRWEMKTGYPKEKNGYSVFSCFSCGGGSTMGYKLAGYDVIGCNEIDRKMMKVYINNHHPKYHFRRSISEFKNTKNLPDALFNLDILDGSPPCSSFSMVGNREKDWGKSKKFKEGQECQILDTLFFDFIDLAKRLQPKIVIAENVPGILLGTAIKYVAKIHEEFDKAGYYLFHRLLDASVMGVPQARKRVFFFAIRKDISKHISMKGLFQNKPFLDLKFNKEPIKFKEIKAKDSPDTEIKTGMQREHWDKKLRGDTGLVDVYERTSGGKQSFFSHMFIFNNLVMPTLTSSNSKQLMLFDFPRYPVLKELILTGTFPLDYNFLKIQPGYLIGMSVPPVMMAQISKQVQIQWLDKIYKGIKNGT